MRRGSSIHSPAEDPSDRYTHKGLTYPFGRSFPNVGCLLPVADGVRWARMPVPGPLKHVNIWVLDDSDGVAIVDTGLAISSCREAWDQLLAGALADVRVTRVIVTHFHPDHLGLAGWLCERFAAPLMMTRTEWQLGRLLTADVRDAPPGEALAHWRMAGWNEARIAAEAAKGWGRFASVVSPVPMQYLRMVDGREIAIGARIWRIVTGRGHSPEHACLVDEAGGLMIAGDQVLPRITSNVSLTLSEPDEDPLGDWLRSIAKLRVLSDDLLVLPGHGDPFTGLHARLDALADGHAMQLDALHAHLAEPRRAVDCFSLLFSRAVDDGILGLATGEALAHLRHLEVEGRAVREMRDGVAWFSAD